MHSYTELKDWLENDLGCITNLDKLAVICKDFLQKINKLDPQPQTFIDNVTLPLQNILATIEDITLDQSKKNSIINKLLKDVFTNSFFAEEQYLNRKSALTSPSNYEAEIVSRLKSPNPLITLDALCVLKDDPRNLSQAERAATLIAATLNIYSRLKEEKQASFDGTMLNWNAQGAWFSRTVVTTDNGNTIHSASQSDHITVLVNGQAYYLPVLDSHGKPLSFEIINTNLAEIITHFEQEGNPGLLGCITSAPRKLCHEVRKTLESSAENAQALRLIDQSLFVVCLDRDKNFANDREKQIKNLFTNFTNRWYGATQIVVDPSSKAGIIGSYTRGDNPSAGFPLYEKIVDLALAIPTENKTLFAVANDRYKKLTFTLPKNEFSNLMEATLPYFHKQNSLFKLDVGVAFFLKRGLHPNAALQMLIMLAARDLDPQKRLPIFMQALAVDDADSTGSSLDWVFVPTHKINQFITAKNSKKASNTELFSLFKEATAAYAETIKKTSEGWSPTFFLQKPEGELYTALAQFFVTIGTQLEGGYAGYIFRPARLPGSVDILTSFHKLPNSITLMGRPGGTLEAVSKFGVHVAFTRNSTEFSWMPNVSANIDLLKLDTTLKKWIAFIEKIAEKAM